MAVAAVSVLAEQRARPGRIPWYPWALTGLAAGGSIVLNFAHPYLPLSPPPRWLVAAVYGVPPMCVPFAWHLFLLRIAHRRQHPRHHGQDGPVFWQQVAERTGLSRSRAYALLREERARRVHPNGHA